MTLTNSNDKLPPAKQRRSVRIIVLALLGTIFVLGLGAVIMLGYSSGQEAGRAAASGSSSGHTSQFAQYLFPLSMIIAWMTFATMAPGGNSTDAKQARARWMTLLLVVMALLHVPYMQYKRSTGLDGSSFDPETMIPFAPIIMLGAVLYLGPGFLSTTTRRLLNDEVTRSFRLRALQLGYFLLLIILVAFCLVEQQYSEIATRILPLGLVAGAVIPTLYFLFLDWRASRGG